ncbi:MAG: hypothetical protein DRJ31_04055 [Candidatus Methanomethylicota archaeon]|nr:MAG: hypothetical protein DRJ31_04055 [Candidatus Verstraetearchaeota archaeon]
MLLSRYATISVPAEVKKILEKAKGSEEWGKFLLKLYEEYERLKGLKAFEQLRHMLSAEELEEISKSSLEFRERFKLR